MSRPVSRATEHVGELRLALHADTLEELFAEAARFVARQCGSASGNRTESVKIRLSARDLPTLLADWINELIGQSEMAGCAFGDFDSIKIGENTIEAAVSGRPVARWHSPIKAATYHGALVEERKGRCRAIVLLDV